MMSLARPSAGMMPTYPPGQSSKKTRFPMIGHKVSRDHVHVLISYRLTQPISKIVQWFKGISSRVLLQQFGHVRRKFCGRHLWARGYLAVSSGTVTDEMIKAYIDEQQGETVQEESRFQIDESSTPRLVAEGPRAARSVNLAPPDERGWGQLASSSFVSPRVREDPIVFAERR